MIRISPAVPLVPNTMTGIHICLSRSQSLAMLQGASSYCGENRPPTLSPKYAKAIHISTKASRKSGVASPRKPKNVAR